MKMNLVQSRLCPLNDWGILAKVPMRLHSKSQSGNLQSKLPYYRVSNLMRKHRLRLSQPQAIPASKKNELFEEGSLP